MWIALRSLMALLRGLCCPQRSCRLQAVPFRWQGMSMLDWHRLQLAHERSAGVASTSRAATAAG